MGAAQCGVLLRLLGLALGQIALFGDKKQVHSVCSFLWIYSCRHDTEKRDEKQVEKPM